MLCFPHMPPWRDAVAALGCALVAGCGARTGLFEEPPSTEPPPAPHCVSPPSSAEVPVSSLSVTLFPGQGTLSLLDVAGDARGEIVLAGNLQGTINLGGGARTSQNGSGFLATFDAHGAHLFDRVYDQAYFSVMAVDADGNFFATGYLSGTDFSGNPLAINGVDFVAKLDRQGNPLWSKTVVPTASTQGGGPTLSGIGHNNDALVVDRCGNVFVSGYSHPPAPAPDVNGSGLFVTKYDPSGTVLWSTAGLDYGSAEPWAFLALDAADDVLLFAGSSTELFELDPNGNPSWHQRTNMYGALAIGTDATGQACVTMPYSAPFALGNVVLPDPGHMAVAVVCFDAVGNATWATQLALSAAAPSTMTRAADGTVLVAGSGAAKTTFEPLGPLVDAYDAQGNVVWAWAGPTGPMAGVSALGLDRLGYPVVAGLLPKSEAFLAFDGSEQ